MTSARLQMSTKCGVRNVNSYCCLRDADEANLCREVLFTEAMSLLKNVAAGNLFEFGQKIFGGILVTTE